MAHATGAPLAPLPEPQGRPAPLTDVDGVEFQGEPYTNYQLWRWIRQRTAEGIPAGVREFLEEHGYCLQCRGRGQTQIDLPQPPGRPRAFRYLECPACRGTGLALHIDGAGRPN